MREEDLERQVEEALRAAGARLTSMRRQGGGTVEVRWLFLGQRLVSLVSEDGLRVIDGKVARISARHNGKKMTNVMMADGHAESLPTKSLPQLDEHLQRKGGQDPWQKGYFYKNPQWRFDHP